MTKFLVMLVETVRYQVEVEAEDGDKAEELARETWNASQDPIHDFCGDGQGVEVLYHEILRDDGTVIEPGDPDDQ
jgi:hypothetical protein